MLKLGFTRKHTDGFRSPIPVWSSQASLSRVDRGSRGYQEYSCRHVRLESLISHPV